MRAHPRLHRQRAVKATHAMSRDSRHPRRLADLSNPFSGPVPIVIPEEQVLCPLPLRKREQVDPEKVRHLQRSLTRLRL